MNCPLKQYNPTTYYQDIRWKNCDKTQCEWWDPTHHQCCIHTIAEKIDTLKGGRQ